MGNGSSLVVVAHLAVLAKHKDNCNWDVKKTPVFPFSPTPPPEGVLGYRQKEQTILPFLSEAWLHCKQQTLPVSPALGKKRSLK